MCRSVSFRATPIGRRDVVMAAVCSIVSLMCLLAAMEELSWGQRILGYESPPYFVEHNLQQEANFHNLDIVEQGDATRWLHGLMAAGLFYCALAWLLVPRRWRTALGERAVGLIPAGALAPYFLLFLLWNDLAAGWAPDARPWQCQEVTELVLYSGVGLHLWMVWKAYHGARTDRAAPRSGARRGSSFVADALRCMCYVSIGPRVHVEGRKGEHDGELETGPQASPATRP